MTTDGFVIDRVPAGRAARARDRQLHRRRRAVRRVPSPAPSADRAGRSTRSPPPSGPRIGLRMLDHWDNLDGSIERGYAGRSLWRWDELPDTVSPRYARLRARQRVDRHQRRRAQQRQRQRADPDAGLSAQGGGAGRRVPARGASASFSPRAGARRSSSAALRHRRSAGRRRRRLVAREGRRDLRAGPRLRRLPGQGQLRGPARPAGLRPHARRRRQHAGRRARARTAASSSGARSSTRPTSPRIAPSRRTTSSCRSTDRSGRT